MNTQKAEKSEYIPAGLRLLFRTKPFWRICASLCTVLWIVPCNTALVAGERVQSSKLGSSSLLSPNLSQLNDGQCLATMCNTELWYHNAVESSPASPLLFSLQDSPPDGLSHTLWRTGGGETGDPKKQENSAWLKKRRGSLDLIDKVLSAVSEYSNSVELYIVVVCWRRDWWCHLIEITVHITIILFCVLYPLAQYCISKANIGRIKSVFLQNHFWELKRLGLVFVCKENGK